MEENCDEKLREKYSRLQVEVLESLKGIPNLKAESNDLLATFENITAPLMGLSSKNERYWIAKTVLLVEYLHKVLPDEERVVYGLLTCCGYESSEINRIQTAVRGKLEKKLIKRGSKAI